MQKRNKSGGIVDRRFGENDPTMAPEDRMLERFTREKQKRVRGGDIFNLEDDELTHFGQTLGGVRTLGQGIRDDFEGASEDDYEENPIRLARKRPLGVEDDGMEADGAEEGPERKKSKAEVMKEVIAKSKLHKYERQKAKEDDEEEREKLDAEMGDLWALLGAKQPSTTGNTSGANSEPLGGGETKAPTTAPLPKDDGEQRKKELDYDQAVREMMFDKRSKPAERTKTEEEKAAEESERLKKQEEARQRRMRGEESDDEQPADAMDDDKIDEEFTEATAYGLGDGIPVAQPRVLPHDDNPEDFLDGDYEVSEDGYVDVDEEGMVDGDGVFSDDDESSAEGSDEDEDEDDDEEDFLADVLPSNGIPRQTAVTANDTDRSERLAFTFPCPQTHNEMLEVVKDIALEDTPTVVQRIRVLHHAKLAAENKEKLQVGLF
jgi:nucleolar protein 14